MVPSIIPFLGKVIGVSLLAIAVIAIGGNILVHYYPTVPGHYSYVVSITGLSDYQGDPITEVVVPIPAIGGSPVFSEKDLQRMISGNCTPLPVMTKDGEMLALRLVGTDLTDISAAKSRDFSKDPSLEEVQEGVFVPSSLWPSETANASPYIIIPDSLRPVSSDPGPISISINVTVFGSTTFGEHRPDYLISIVEQIPPGRTGIIPVEPRIYYRDSFREAFRPLEENVGSRMGAGTGIPAEVIS
ncbi:hypothetical protein F8E02_03005 [Methanoculleus sp. Wushi-C6]|uniref:MacB-like periplasmic core domain-containing protein n=1 Tax=Methanoculleus caldifontis TaxID=2651577 RepID=A0ABU3X047_9EURY|nr:hypothetical protein [Methanoculleus sp. Wushi-C6]MDV2480992.1 hypothetical protein [Methanoculleus sp. Wushi-C6]